MVSIGLSQAQSASIQTTSNGRCQHNPPIQELLTVQDVDNDSRMKVCTKRHMSNDTPGLIQMDAAAAANTGKTPL
jgi:hypothetical protein